MSNLLNDFKEFLALIPFGWISLGIAVLPLVLGLFFVFYAPKLSLLVLKNLRRNILRTSLTSLAIMVLVLMVTMILSVLFFIKGTMEEKSRDFKLIVTERWQLPSQMPLSHANYLDPTSPSFILDPKDVGPKDFMTWSFYGGTLDPEKMSRENLLFFFVMNPDHIRPMMEDLENYDPALIKKLKETRNGCLVGKERLAMVNNRVGGRFKVTSINYKGIDLDFEIVGELPEGRYDLMGIMNAEYFNQALDNYARTKNSKHPLDEKRLNLIWLRVPDRAAFDRVAALVESASVFNQVPVKCETASSGIASFLDAYRDLFLFTEIVLVPGILISMALVVSNSISISVRERRAEMAVMKVLGYRPGQILGSVLGESLLVGGVSGLLAAGLTYVLINLAAGGIKFPIAFFPAFLIPWQAFYWGLAMGFATSFAGSFFPAWTARNVKVSEVFSKVA